MVYILHEKCIFSFANDRRSSKCWTKERACSKYYGDVGWYAHFFLLVAAFKLRCLAESRMRQKKNPKYKLKFSTFHWLLLYSFFSFAYFSKSVKLLTKRKRIWWRNINLKKLTKCEIAIYVVFHATCTLYIHFCSFDTQMFYVSNLCDFMYDVCLCVCLSYIKFYGFRHS